MEGQVMVYVTTKNTPMNERYFEGWSCADNKAIKDPAKQDAWKADKKIKEMEDNRLAVTNKIVGFALVNINNHEDITIKVDGDEKQVLNAISGWLANKETDVWMKNAKNYSLPFLVKRFIANGVRMPRILAPLRQEFTQFKLYDTNDIIGSYSSACEEAMTSIDDDFFLVTGEYIKSHCDVRLCSDMIEKGDHTATEELKDHLRLQGRKLATYVKRATDSAGV